MDKINYEKVKDKDGNVITNFGLPGKCRLSNVNEKYKINKIIREVGYNWLKGLKNRAIEIKTEENKNNHKEWHTGAIVEVEELYEDHTNKKVVLLSKTAIKNMKKAVLYSTTSKIIEGESFIYSDDGYKLI